jgi:uncharacterized membrane protein
MLLSVLHSFGKAIFWLASFLCHQRPERSPHLFGAQFPFCWRCTGIIAGSMALVILLILRRRLPSLVTSVGLALLMPLDVGIAAGGVWGGHNSLRLITGFLFGLCATVAVVRILKNENFVNVVLGKFNGSETTRNSFTTLGTH